MKILKKIISVILCIFIIVSGMQIVAFAQETNIIEINNIEDYYAFAQKTKNDLYTQGMTVKLNCDIDFRNNEFIPISQFNGVFEGNQHNFTSITIDKCNSIYGIFRTIGQDGIVKDLNVQITIKSNSIGESIGGVVGINYGTVVSCNCAIDLTSIKNSGGIVGINYGTIQTCTVTGSILGEHKIGGIAGTNTGTIVDCKNIANVEDKYVSVTTNENAMISYIPKELANLLLPEEIKGITDIGGIAGYSEGAIIDCINRGTVGYKAQGANIGGIVGRGELKIINSKNYGDIFGKNEVGGIIGQLIPTGNWEYGESKLTAIQDKLSSVHKKTDLLINDGETISKDLSEVIQALNNSEDSLNEFLSSGEKWIDSSIKNINVLQERIYFAISYMKAATSEINKATESIHEASKSLEKTIQSIEETVEYYDDNSNAILNVLNSLRSTIEDIVIIKDDIKGVIDNVSAMENDAKDIEEVYEDFYTFIKSLIEMLGTLSLDLSKLSEYIDLAKQFYPLLSSLVVVEIKSLVDKTKNKLEDIVDKTNGSKEYIKDSIITLGTFISSLLPLIDSLKEEYLVIVGSFNYVENALENTEDCFKNINTSIENIQNCFDYIDNGFAYLLVGNVVKFEYSKDYISKPQKELFDRLEILNDKLNKLSSGVIDDEYSQHVKELSNDLFDLFDLIIETLNDLSNIQSRQFIYDTSSEYNDANIDNYDSIIYKCENEAEIIGEKNIGGIVGYVNFDLDNIEEVLDLKGLIYSGSRYVIFTQISECINSGNISGTKDNIGGIAGYIKYGNISYCNNISQVTTNGSYVGGIVGRSEGNVENSKAQVTIKGKNYVGGISGKSKNLIENISIPNIISSEEYSGAVSGICDGTIINNIYGVFNIGGINGFDYSGKAEFSSVEDFITKNNFKEHVTLTFISNDKEFVYTIPYNSNYSDSPKIEDLKDQYWVWDEYQTVEITEDLVINGKYVNNLQALSTPGKLPDVFVQGSFKPNNELIVIDNNQIDYSIINESDLLMSKTITVSDYDEKLTIRLKAPKDGNLYEIKKGSDGSTKYNKIKYDRELSYIIFSLDNGGTFAYQKIKDLTWLYILIAVVIVLLIIGCIIIIVVHNKKKKIKIDNSNEQIKKD